jgi:hypothetical protein
MDPATKKPDHNGGKSQCQGGPGCSALCGATDFYDRMEESMHAWSEKTKRSFESHSYINAIFLPRQARDNRRESTQKQTGFSGGERQE